MQRIKVFFVVLLAMATVWGGVVFAQGDIDDQPGPLVSAVISLASALSVPGDVEVAMPEPPLYAKYDAIPQSRTADGAFVLGDPAAPVTVVAFEDFTCPHCQDYEETVQQFIDEYVVTGQAQFEYRFFPIVDPVYAPYTAQLAECADELRSGAFWPAHDLIFAMGSAGEIGENTSQRLALELGLNHNALISCAADATQYTVDAQLAQAMGVSGTPGIMVRYGDSPLEWIEMDGTVYNRGGVSFDVLSRVVELANGPNA